MKKKITLFLLLCVSGIGNVFAQSIESLPLQGIPKDTLMFVFNLHGQTRRYQITYEEKQDTIFVHWGIERYLKWQSGSFAMGYKSVEQAIRLNFLQPEDGKHVHLTAEETVAMISRAAYNQLKKQHSFVYGQTTYSTLNTDEKVLGYSLIRVKDTLEGCEMWILDNSCFPLIWRIRNNPLGINWEVHPISR